VEGREQPILVPYIYQVLILLVYQKKPRNNTTVTNQGIYLQTLTLIGGGHLNGRIQFLPDLLPDPFQMQNPNLDQSNPCILLSEVYCYLRRFLFYLERPGKKLFYWAPH
jgi:hypothetical protein